MANACHFAGQLLAAQPNLPRDQARLRDLAQLRDLTGPHLPTPPRRSGPALAHMTLDDRAKTIAILGRIGDPREGATDDDVA
jgi:hypothetical protein